MPDIYTHILSGRESLKMLEPSTAGIITNWLNIFYLGCMGPDLFLYHNFYPWEKDKAVKELGDKMHNKHCGEFIIDALTQIKETSEESNKLDERAVYMLGYICHYATDRTAHPYIFYKSGMYDVKKPETHKYKNSHKIMELSIDYHMSKKLDNEDINYKKMYQYIDIGQNIHCKISELYNKLLGIHFKEDVNMLEKDFVNESYHYIKQAWKIFYDPYSLKRRVFKVFDYECYFYPVNPYDRDYMNENREVWANPCSPDIKSNKTFYQIFDQCQSLAHSLMSVSVKYLNNDIDKEELKRNMGNYSFTTNMDVQYGENCMKHFNPIF